MNYNNSTKMQILRAVKDAGEHGVENWKLSQITLGYRSRLTELRHDGYDIRPRRVYRNGKASGTYVYYIHTDDEPVAKVEPVSEPEDQQIKLMDTPKPKRGMFF